MTSPQTLTALFFSTLDRQPPGAVVMRARRNAAWAELTARDLLDAVHDFSLGLQELGVRAGDRVALISENRPEWAVTDLACLAAGCADVPIYPTLPAVQMEYMLRDSGAVAVCLSSKAQLEKVRLIREGLPALRWVIAFDPDATGEGVLALSEVQARGRAARDRHPRWREDALRAAPADLATIIYTSGTTGEPKGVMLTHGNIASNVAAALEQLSIQPGDESLSFLPLSHIFERTAGHYGMLNAGVVINYARSVESVSSDILDRRPTVVTSVPRLFEKIYSRVVDAASGSPMRQRIFRWARAVGDRWSDLKLAGRPVPATLAVQHALADRLVFAKLRERVGGRIRYFISGGAPLNADVARFFHAAGLTILEGYGLTETSPVISVNAEGALRIGSVGRPVRDVEVRIAEDGEILTRGPHVMAGYYNKPEATAEAINPEGWFHTGDIGRFDEDGFLYITDRKKDLIVTAGGKNIAPQPIEARIKSNPFISNAVMLGDRRKFPIALLVPEFDRLRRWAAEEGLPSGDDDAALIARPEIQAKLEAEARKHLRDLAQFEVPKKFLLLASDFTIERGELTPKLSVRRKVVEQNYRDLIAAAYREGD